MDSTILLPFSLLHLLDELDVEGSLFQVLILSVNISSGRSATMVET